MQHCIYMQFWIFIHMGVTHCQSHFQLCSGVGVCMYVGDILTCMMKI